MKKSCEPVSISIDAGTTYQTIEGWGATLHELGNPFDEWLADPTPRNYDRLEIANPYPDALREGLLDAAVFDLGLNRFRLEIGPQVEMRRDNPAPADWRTLRFKWQDYFIAQWLLPARDRIIRRGERMILYVSYDLRSSLTPDWLLEPGRYGSLAVATLTYLKERHGLEPDYWSILNEPGNGERPGNPQMISALIKHTGSRIAKAGFRTRISAPETISLSQFRDYMAVISKDRETLSHIGQLTYHVYGDPKSISGRHDVRNWARKLGVSSAQTEWFEGKGLEAAEVLHLDLTEADASVWEQYSLCSLSSNWNAEGGGEYFIVDPDYSGFRWNGNTFWLRQFMKYIRPGAVRVRTSTTDDAVKACAFMDSRGLMVVVVINPGAGRKLKILDVRPGTYGISLYAADGLRKSDARTVEKSGGLACDMPARSIVTFFQGTQAAS